MLQMFTKNFVYSMVKLQKHMTHGVKTTVGEELADIAIYLMGLSEILDIDLETEIEKKMAINKDRVYQLVDGVLTKTSSDN